LVFTIAVVVALAFSAGSAHAGTDNTRITTPARRLAGAEYLRSQRASIRLAENQSNHGVTEEARTQASEIFEERCAACHGTDGRGDGPAAANLKPKPADFHSVKWQKSMTDDRIARAIIHGGGSVGVSNQMAPNPDLENEPAVVGALVERIRKFGR
jgi:mono/diheme cytochrome c family protein